LYKTFCILIHSGGKDIPFGAVTISFGDSSGGSPCNQLYLKSSPGKAEQVRAAECRVTSPSGNRGILCTFDIGTSRNMRHLLLLAALFPHLVIAQSAPDFNVTDIQGQTRTLYADYLNAGRTVLLKVFDSSCPPCHAEADAIQELYADWGAGSHDVEFIAVSNKAWETNQTALAYVNKHGIRFPTVSATGGSVAVCNAYGMGGLGNLYGTPTYIVIAPDGAVQWDIEFSDLDQALSATGAEKPVSPGASLPHGPDEIWIAPNPSNEFLAIYANGQEKEQLRIHVYSILGSRLFTFYPERQSSELLLREDASDWLTGTYLVRVEREDRVLKTMRFVRR
jgi:peroxiredoxin